MYSLEGKLYITQRAENQRDVGLNVGFVYSLYSFFATLLFVYRGVLKINQEGRRRRHISSPSWATQGERKFSEKKF